ncbi:Hypothetical protein UVM_LOCUS187 [uncultured virus]|nr:Hypothetical protein UVM_LOCUS187 [uncultured virus]
MHDATAAYVVGCPHDPPHRRTFATQPGIIDDRSSKQSRDHLLCLHRFDGTWEEFCCRPAFRVGIQLYVYDEAARPRLRRIEFPFAEYASERAYSVRSGHALASVPGAPYEELLIVRSDGTLTYFVQSFALLKITVEMCGVRDMFISHAAFDLETSAELLRATTPQRSDSSPDILAFIVNPSINVEINGRLLSYDAASGLLSEVNGGGDEHIATRSTSQV